MNRLYDVNKSRFLGIKRSKASIRFRIPSNTAYQCTITSANGRFKTCDLINVQPRSLITTQIYPAEGLSYTETPILHKRSNAGDMILSDPEDCHVENGRAAAGLHPVSTVYQDSPAVLGPKQHVRPTQDRNQYLSRYHSPLTPPYRLSSRNNKS